MTAAVVAFTVLASLGAITAVAYVVLVKIDSQESDAGEVCLTQGCKSKASRINEYIDYSAPPCDDMYQFACGGFLKKYARLDSKPRWDQHNIAREQINKVLKGVLEAKYTESAPNYEKQVKILYASCMDEGAIKKQGGAGLKRFLKHTFNGWPMADHEWDASNFDLVETMTKMSLYKSPDNLVLMGAYVGVDTNSFKGVLKIDQTSFGLQPTSYFKDRDVKVLKAYKGYISGVALLLGGKNVTQIQNDTTEMVDFEIKLANIVVSDEDKRDSSMTLANISKQYNFDRTISGGLRFDWNDYIKQLLTQQNINITVPNEEIIINMSPSYYGNLTQLLQDTEPRTVANYLMYRLLEPLLQTQDESYLKLRRDLDRVLHGSATKEARHKTCIKYVTNPLILLYPAVNRMFTDGSLDATSKAIAVSMTKELQKAFDELVTETVWMDEATKYKAIEKNKLIKSIIGTPEIEMNDTYLNNIYLDYSYKKEDFLGNYLNNMIRLFVKNTELLRKPSKDIISQSALLIAYFANAAYRGFFNQIFIAAGFLQPPFFSKTYPQYLNYGSAGVTIGHEITHGFDSNGRQFDGEGNKVQWWSNASLAQFKYKVQCLIDQYSNFTVPEVKMNVNGTLTENENIADNGGVREAYRAYRNWVSRYGREVPKLPGLNFSNNQLFFIEYSQTWCTVFSKEALLRQVKDVHAPPQFRVIGPLQNSEDFAEAFNCPKSSFMNPDKRCIVW